MKKLSVLFLMIAVLMNGQMLSANEADEVCESKVCIEERKLNHTTDW